MFIANLSWTLLAFNVLWASASAAKTESPDKFTFDQLWTLQNALWKEFVYPQNLKQINATDDSVFTADVQGRVDITRTFDGRELNAEYIFGLFSEPDHVSLVGIPIDYNITQFVANDNLASATTVITFNATTFGIVVPVTIDTWFQWNADGKIERYDATFRWFDYLVQTLFGAMAQQLNTTSETEVTDHVGQILADTICKTHEENCHDENQQYDSTEQCVDYLVNKTRFGKPFELGRDTLLCREVHEHMVKYRPDIHCAHIGPSGGDYCVDDKSYEQVVLDRYFTESWIPFGYGEKQNIWLPANSTS